MSKACPSDLLPCPFCGAQPGEMLDSQGRTWARCRPCGIEYVRAEKWNRRTTVAALQDATAQQQAQPECPRCGLTVSPESCDCAEARAVRTKQRAEPAADEWAEFETALKQYAEACHRSESCSAMDAARARVCAIFSRAAQSGQRAGVDAAEIMRICRLFLDGKEGDYDAKACFTAIFKIAAAPTQQQEGGS